MSLNMTLILLKENRTKYKGDERQKIDLTGKKFVTNVFDRQNTRSGPL